jgi:hypothetical protein
VELRGFGWFYAYLKIFVFNAILKEKMTSQHSGFSEDVKEKLKLCYTLVKDRHTELNANIQQVKTLIEKNILVENDAVLVELNSEISTKLYQFELDLKNTDLTLYPSLKYSLDTKDMNDALSSLKLSLFEDDAIDSNKNENQPGKLNELKQKPGGLVDVENNSVFECTITSGLSDYAICWIQISNRQVSSNRKPEELKKRLVSRKASIFGFHTKDRSCFLLRNVG